MDGERENFFRVIHKAMRAALARLGTGAGRTDFCDPGELSRLQQSAEETFALLEEHAANEERFVMPLLRRCAPQVAARIDAGHEAQEHALGALRQRLAGAAAAGAGREGHRFLLELTRFQAEQLAHMADEEELAQPALWRAYDDEALRRVHGELLASIPLQELARLAALMLPAMNSPERATLMAGMRATAPAPAFEGLLQVAASALDAPSFSRLREDLGLSRAA